MVMVPTFIRHDMLVDWGSRLRIMESNGNGFVDFYTYNDDPKTAYLCDLSVSPDFRRQGIGSVMIGLCEDIAKTSGYKHICLWVEKGSWMYSWYQRRGYRYMKRKAEDENTIWMRKALWKS